MNSFLLVLDANLSFRISSIGKPVKVSGVITDQPKPLVVVGQTNKNSWGKVERNWKILQGFETEKQSEVLVLGTFILVIIYFALGTITSAQGCWENSRKPVNENNGRNCSVGTNIAESSKSKTTISFWANKVRATVKVQSYHEQDAVKEIAGFWGYLMQTVYQTCAGAVVLTDIVFWFLIVPFLSIERVKLNLLMGCMHSLNAVFLLIDAALNSLPFPWFRLAYFILFSSTYVIFQWVIHACGVSWWPYPLLDLSIPWAPLWYFL
ncbi:uncharacterized protein LOC113358887 [Papaver somniferum]|uniref:uncharacterized protein LOC113358887 n=1 Tax=Papaver somniferum TaxID=3469 RepID=UPI000E6FF952|nr:uncharacterized protein LOC113358887 [Papaver somniferum]